jgi:osmotically-inducible protein OsmY
MVARVRRAVARPAVDLSDTTVVQRIRSEALRDVGVSTRDVEVAVDHGVATVEGTVDGRKVADDLVTRVSKVPGVNEVAAIIRVSGEPGDTT